MSKATKIVLLTFASLALGLFLLLSLFSYSPSSVYDSREARAPGPFPARAVPTNTAASQPALAPTPLKSNSMEAGDRQATPTPIDTPSMEPQANQSRRPQSEAPARILPTPMPTQDRLSDVGDSNSPYEEEVRKRIMEERAQDRELAYMVKKGVSAGAEKTGDVIDRILAEMDFGNIAFNSPDRMKLNSPSAIQLVVSPTETIEKLKESIVAEGQKQGEQIRISDTMEARLTGTAFQIGAITPELQAVTAKEPTSWKWEVKPTQYGRHNLHLTLSAVVTLKGSSVPRTIRTFEKTIEVEVSSFQRTFLLFRENWEWMWTLVVFPLIALSAWLWKRKQNENDGAKPPPAIPNQFHQRPRARCNRQQPEKAHHLCPPRARLRPWQVQCLNLRPEQESGRRKEAGAGS